MFNTKVKNESTTVNESIQWGYISKGNIVVKTEAGDPAAESRVNKNGTKVYEIKHKNFSGLIRNIYATNSQYGVQYVISFSHEGGVFNLTIQSNSPMADSFFKQIFNIDPNLAVAILPYNFENDKGRKVTGFSIKQGEYGGEFNNKVKREFPKGTPELKFDEIDGRFILNTVSKLKQQKFLQEKLNEYIIENDLQPVVSWFRDDIDVITPMVEELKREIPSLSKTSSSQEDTDENKDFDDLFDKM